MLSLSPGAQRVLDRLLPRGEYTALDLLESLWVDESRAHDLLTLAGMTDDGVSILRQPMAAESPPPEVSSEAVWPVADFLHLVKQHTNLEGRGEEIRTEHLLLAALEIPSFCRLLSQIGLDLPSLRMKLPWSSAPEPLNADIQLRTTHVTAVESMAVYRILDASANRCREGLRVVEDYARMILNDGDLSRRVKGIRHQLAPLLSRLNLDRAIRARDIEHDVGTTIRTPFEMARPSAWSVAVANAKRVEESLRTLEEYGKTLDVLSAAAIGQLRYQFYGVESALYASYESNTRLEERLLYLLVTDNQCPQGAGPLVKAALRGGVDVVQMREKEMPDSRRVEWGKWLREWTAEAGALLVINDRPDLACLVDADGVHVGQGDLPVMQARQIVGSERLVGVSTHTLAQAQQAIQGGADYIGVGPVFPSKTKAFTEFAGLELVGQVASAVSLPAYAIGGIDAANLVQVAAAGARRIAVSNVICQAEDPEAVARQLKESLLLIRQAESES